MIPSFEVGTGKIIAHYIEKTRTSNDFASLVEDTIDIAPKTEWIFIADQLNTHKIKRPCEADCRKTEY